MFDDPVVNFEYPPDALDVAVGVAMEAHRLWYGLTGTRAPRIAFISTSREQVLFGSDDARLVVYVYPGSDGSDQDDSDMRLADSEEHRGFRDLREDFAARDLTVVGLSSQPVERLREVIAEDGLPQQLVCDSKLRLAGLLNLPTFTVGGKRFYRRLTLVLTRGEISRVHYPVNFPGRHAAEVLAGLRGTY